MRLLPALPGLLQRPAPARGCSCRALCWPLALQQLQLQQLLLAAPLQSSMSAVQRPRLWLRLRLLPLPLQRPLPPACWACLRPLLQALQKEGAEAALQRLWMAQRGLRVQVGAQALALALVQALALALLQRLAQQWLAQPLALAASPAAAFCQQQWWRRE